jgi:hypothetical protein
MEAQEEGRGPSPDFPAFLPVGKKIFLDVPDHFLHKHKAKYCTS